MKHDDELSPTDQRFYDAYSGLEYPDTELDADDVEFELMDDIDE
jgi:hypothetical protein